jgi:hypothetical protein
MRATLLAALLLVQDDELSSLIRKLGSADAAVREKAEKRLLELDEKAEPALKDARKSSDAEIANRAATLLLRMERGRKEKELEERERKQMKEGLSISWRWGNDVETIGRGKTVMKKEKDGIRIETTRRGEKYLDDQYKMSLLCAANPTFSPQTIESTYEGAVKGDGFFSYKAKVADGKLVARFDSGKEKTLKVSDRLVVWDALPKIIAALPQIEGHRIAVDLLRVEDFDLEPGCVIEAVGPEKVRHGGKEITSWKWTLTLPDGNPTPYPVWWVADRKVIRCDSRETGLAGGQGRWEFDQPD